MNKEDNSMSYLEVRDLPKNYCNNYTEEQIEMGIVVAHAFWKGNYDGIDMWSCGEYHGETFYISFCQCSKELGFLDEIKDIRWDFDAMPPPLSEEEETIEYLRVLPDALKEFLKRQGK